MLLTRLLWRDTTNEVSSVLERLFTVERSLLLVPTYSLPTYRAAREALDKQLRILVHVNVLDSVFVAAAHSRSRQHTLRTWCKYLGTNDTYRKASRRSAGSGTSEQALS